MDKLSEGIKEYMNVKMSCYSEEDVERMVAGVKAFIWVNYYRDPYLPVNIFPIEEEEKKWWQFWR